MVIKKANNLTKLLFTLLIVTYPILNQYASFIHSSIGLSDIVYIIFLIILFFTGLNKKLIVNTEYTIFVFSILIFTIVDIFLVRTYSLYDVAFRVLRDILYWSLIAIAIPNLFQIDLGLKLIKGFAFLSTFGVLLQIIVYIVYNKMIPLWLPITFRGGFTQEERIEFILQYAQEMYYRPYGLFTEPTYMALFSIIAVLLYLFYDTSLSNIFKAIFLTVGILLSTSASGIILAGIIWLIWCFKILVKRKWHKNIIVFSTLIILTGFCSILIIFFKTSLGELLINRLNEIDNTVSTSSSGYMRILRGYHIFAELDIKNIFTGIGIGNLYPYMLNHPNMSHFLVLQGEANEYVNSVSYFLISTGILGFSFIILLFLKWYKSTNSLGKITVVTTVLLMLSDSIYNSSIWILLMTLIFHSDFNKE